MRTVNDGLNIAKKRVFALLNKVLKIALNMGRNKYVTFNGKITNAYPAIFIIVSDENKTYSLSYSDLVTGKVKLFRPTPKIQDTTVAENGAPSGI